MPEILGDTSGIRKTILDRINKFYNHSMDKRQIIAEELLQEIVEVSELIQREIAVYISRHGKVLAVVIGDIASVSLPEQNQKRSQQNLCGVRCIHTHPGQSGQLSMLDTAALRELRFDVMVSVGQRSGEMEFGVAFLEGRDVDGGFSVSSHYPVSAEDLFASDISVLIQQIEAALGRNASSLVATGKERAILVGMEWQGGWGAEESLAELGLLAETAGAEVVGRFWQKREKPDAALFIGKGKAKEVAMLRQEAEASIIIFDDVLSPAQQRNLEQVLGVKVVDRAALILDIFAQRARSHEGKMQVELAQLKYRLPRLGGQGLILSRLGGGIGTRGPGETKLEVDRRRIRSRISEIETSIGNVRKQRALHRKARQAANTLTVALVGYTNAGKSTLLNYLTQAGVLAEDKLFATLDPTTRMVKLPEGKEVLFTDTVGFIQKLPHQLIAAFRATLEEVVEADLLLHVVDASHPQWEEQREEVFKVLKELKAETKAMLMVYNKTDLVANKAEVNRMLRDENSVAISALTGEGMMQLLRQTEVCLTGAMEEMELLIPYQETASLTNLYKVAQVKSLTHDETGTRVVALVPKEYTAMFTAYLPNGVH